MLRRALSAALLLCLAAVPALAQAVGPPNGPGIGGGGGSSGFPFTLGSTSVASGATVPSVTGLASLGITAPAVNSTALTLSGISHTGTDATSDISLTGTWNTSGAATGIFANYACTSCANALLMNLEVGGVSQFTVDSGGSVTIPTGSVINLGYNLARITGYQQEVDLQNYSGTKFIRFSFPAANSLQFGSADDTIAIAQTLSVQNVVAGTTNAAGADFTVDGSRGTGTGAGGSIIFQTAPAGSSGTAQNALATVLTLDSTKMATFAGGITAASLPTSGTATGSVCVTSAGVLFVKTTTGACL